MSVAKQTDFMFQLTAEEVKECAHRSQIATGSQKHRDPRFLPFVFTEHGAIMAATILNSQQAVQMSVFTAARVSAWPESHRLTSAATMKGNP